MTLIATEAERVLGSAEDSRLIASVGEARHKDTAWHLSNYLIKCFSKVVINCLNINENHFLVYCSLICDKRNDKQMLR